MDLPTISCECVRRPVLMQGHFSGLVLLLCPACKRRIWLASDGNDIRQVFEDEPPPKL